MSKPQLQPLPSKPEAPVDGQDFLPFHLPCFGDEEIEEVVDTLKSGWWTTGPKTKRFEEDFAAYAGSKYAVAVNSATAGLHLALEAIGIGPGDKVVTSTYTFTATAEVVRYLGADVVLVDVDADSLNLDLELLKSALENDPTIKAIVPVHFAGQACPMKEIQDLATRHDAKIVEDAAHALPTTYQGQTIGNIGDVTAFSFYVTKTLATGEGGMVTTNDEQLAQRMRTMRLHGISRDAFSRYTDRKPSWFYEVVAPGFKYNMTDVAAALGIHQLRKVEQYRERRQSIAEQYDDAFATLPLRLPSVINPNDVHARHLYVVQLQGEARLSRDSFIEQMFARGIGTSVHFIPLHLHPYWRETYKFQPQQFPVALDAFQRAVSLPIYPSMTGRDIERVVIAVKDILS